MLSVFFFLGGGGGGGCLKKTVHTNSLSAHCSGVNKKIPCLEFTLDVAVWSSLRYDVPKRDEVRKNPDNWAAA